MIQRQGLSPRYMTTSCYDVHHWEHWKWHENPVPISGAWHGACVGPQAIGRDLVTRTKAQKDHFCITKPLENLFLPVGRE